MAAVTAEDKRKSGHISNLARNAIFLGLLWYLYGTVRDVAVVGVNDAFDNARAIVDVQRSVGLDIEAGLQAALGSWWVFKAANWYYLVHFPVTVAVLVGTYFLTRRSRFNQFRNSLVGATAVALLVHVRYPLAPPRMLDGYLDTAAVFGPNPYALPGSDNANQFAAMPSMHVGWAVLVALVLWSATTRPWARVVGISHAMITSAVVIVTANHYVLDVLIGAGLALLAWFLMGQFERRNEDPFANYERSEPSLPGWRTESLRLQLERVSVTQRHPQ
ncbi:MAG: phosphatase PAP2 family protein [Acidimicrobiia bacterium]|nr:phosphatase PAP2 family protein [Acidimicrobiia bacterium]